MTGKNISASSAPLVSIITPFFNSGEFLAACIESVLAQTYSNWEYVLVNNQSTDNGRAIAERYARQDKRIRLFDTATHLNQIDNFEAALKRMSPASKYCKFILADDWMFPECLQRMVDLGEGHPNVGIVSAYQLYGDEIVGDGLPYSTTVLSGREAGRLMLLSGYYLTGSPSSVLFRSEIVRAAERFFPADWIHEDTEACFRLLEHHDLGFIHQVLTFSRKNQGSLTSQVVRLNPGPIRKYMFAKQYGPRFLNAQEYKKHLQAATDFYGQFLAASLFQLRDKQFWDFQRKGLAAVGSDFWSLGLPKYVVLELVDIVGNPKKTIGRLIRLARSREEPGPDQPAQPASEYRSEANSSKG
jgi:glycosyltransferase involved in cell wall biosynthesis